MPDKLDTIFQLQGLLDEDIEKGRGLAFTREEWIKNEVMAINVELSEVLEEVNYRWWKNPSPINEEKLHEEIVDVFHFFISLCRRSGLNSEQLFELYLKKNEENLLRQHGLSEKKGYEQKEAYSCGERSDAEEKD